MGTSFFDNIASSVKKEVKKLPKDEIQSVSSTVDFSELVKQSANDPLPTKKPEHKKPPVGTQYFASTQSTAIASTQSTAPIEKPKTKKPSVGTKILSSDPSMAPIEKPKKSTKKSSRSDIKSLLDFCIQGAKDIISEDVSDNAELRETIKNHTNANGIVQTKPTKTREENGVYKIYGNYSKRLNEIPSYAYLAISRAEKEKQINVDISFGDEFVAAQAEKLFIPRNANTSVSYLKEAIQDGLTRLTLPSIEREIRSDKKAWADEAAIKVFGENMKNLLLTPPIKGKTVLGFDPGFRTGCKLAVVDPTGKFLAKDILFCTLPGFDFDSAEKKLLGLIQTYNINLISIGNGTASRESESFVAKVIKKNNLTDKVFYMVTSEAGASVYSASELAQKEYPTLDVTVRGAISIAHRVQDAMAELTKIDPKSIGVGQYQHDVDQNFLQKKLDEKVQDTVNAVGVDVNTASQALLQYIAGLTNTTAKNIVDYRNETGEFKSKTQIKKAKGMGPKAYEQCVGFLRIKGGIEQLDSTGIHPEHHKAVYEMLEKEFNITKKKLVLPLSLLDKGGGDVGAGGLRELSEKYGIGYETLKDIFQELARPGLDPRDDIPAVTFKSDVLDIKDLKIGMELDGIVRNVTDFGAFVDIGLHNDGLVHKSQMADYYVTNPIEVVSVGKQVKVKVLDIDFDREKVSLTMKDLGNTVNPQKIEYQVKTNNHSSQQDTPRSKTPSKEDEPEEEYSFGAGIGGNINFS